VAQATRDELVATIGPQRGMAFALPSRPVLRDRRDFDQARSVLVMSTAGNCASEPWPGSTCVVRAAPKPGCASQAGVLEITFGRYLKSPRFENSRTLVHKLNQVRGCESNPHHISGAG
jgi:hypothetical protein